MPIRRHTDPRIVQKVWDAVRLSVQQRQLSDKAHLVRYLQRTCNVTPEEIDVYIQNLIKDKLLISIIKPKAGTPTECFKIDVTIENRDDGHDWYCIECHLAGDVIPCETCFRVYHPSCLSTSRANIYNISRPNADNLNEEGLTDNSKITLNSKEEEVVLVDKNLDDGTNKNICNVCHMLQKEKPGMIEKDELNYLLNFTLNRIRMWLPNNITDVMAPRVHFAWMTEVEIAWRVRQLLYQTMDVPLMEMKLRSKEYNRLGEFYADVLTIQHNVAVFHGIETQEWQGSEYMITDSRYDLQEIQQCIDCYRHSNEKRNDLWFCIPCRPPHKLVWAKQKGYPYWPAKLIKTTPEGQMDVRFFGAKHLRAVVDKHCVKPIEESMKKLQIKRTQAFKKALIELHEHQRLLKSPEEVAQILMHTPVLKQKTPNSKTKPKRMKENEQQSDVYEFPDSSLIHSTPTIEKKKRGRKPGSLNKSTKSTMHKFVNNRETIIKPSPDLPVDNNHVSSSTENLLLTEPILSVETSNSSRSRSLSGSLGSLERVYCESVDNLRRQLESTSDKDSIINIALEAMQFEIERLQSVHTEHVRALVTAQNNQISDIKKKQWCYNCEQEAIYHCCWNTAYCSTACQQQHWQAEHKKVCRRKR